MKTPYRELNVGDIYIPVSGTQYEVVVTDVKTYAKEEDAVIKGPNGVNHRIDWFKLMMVRYRKKDEQKQEQQKRKQARKQPERVLVKESEQLRNGIQRKRRKKENSQD